MYNWNDELKGDVVKFVEDLIRENRRLFGSPYRNAEAKAEQLLARLEFEQEEPEETIRRICFNCVFDEDCLDSVHENECVAFRVREKMLSICGSCDEYSNCPYTGKDTLQSCGGWVPYEGETK